MTPIDIKTLHIGSHVSIGGERAKLLGVRALGRVSNAKILQYSTNGIVWAGEVPADSDRVEPMPLTPALLEELGFEPKSYEFSIWWQKKSGKHTIEIDKSGLDEWHVMVKGYDFVIQYLHELESFIYLATQTELIPG